MAKLEEISTSIVRASRCAGLDNSSPVRIEFTPWDIAHLLKGYIQKGLLFHKPEGAEEENLIHRLKSSLCRTLDFFPPLAGRLGIEKFEDETECFFIDCNNTGAEFIHATAHGLTVADILKPKYMPEIIYSLFQLNRVLNCEGTSNPLLSVQVTELDDGYFIGCSMNHCAVDGASYWHFMNSWSEISRGSDRPSKLPSFLHGIPPDHLNRPVRIPALQKQTCDETSLPPLKGRVFHFSKENVAKLKSKANNEIVGRDLEKTPCISSLQALVAHVWRSVTRCRLIKDANKNQNIILILTVGARNRVSPPLPEGYFGNASHGGGVISTPKELLSNGLGWTALKLNQFIAAQTDEETRQVYAKWLKFPPTVPRVKLTNTCLVTSSPRFDMYGNDFGWGKPLAVRCRQGEQFDGKLDVSPGSEEGSIDIHFHLPLDTFEAMENDVEFMQAVSVNY